MEFFDVVARRRSIRAFSPEPPPREALDRVLATLLRAPSAGDLQSYDVVVVEDPAARRALSDAAEGQDAVAAAPVVLVFMTHDARARATYGERGRLFAVQDAAIAAAHAQLAAGALGLGCVWVGKLLPDGVRRAVGAPPGVEPVSLLCLGRPAEEGAVTPRRDPGRVLHRGRFGLPWS